MGGPTMNPLGPSASVIGTRIADAIRTAPTELLPEPKLRRAAIDLGVSDDTLKRYIEGKKNPSALLVWRIGQMTGRTFGWFSGQEDATEVERLAIIAEFTATTAAALNDRLGLLIDELAAARRELVIHVAADSAEAVRRESAERRRERAVLENRADVAHENH